MLSRSPREVQAKAISLLTGMLPMLYAGDPYSAADDMASTFSAMAMVGSAVGCV